MLHVVHPVMKESLKKGSRWKCILTTQDRLQDSLLRTMQTPARHYNYCIINEITIKWMPQITSVISVWTPLTLRVFTLGKIQTNSQRKLVFLQNPITSSKQSGWWELNCTEPFNSCAIKTRWFTRPSLISTSSTPAVGRRRLAYLGLFFSPLSSGIATVAEEPLHHDRTQVFSVGMQRMPKETAPTPAKKHSRRDNPWRNSESIGIRATLFQEEAEKNTNLLGDPAPRSSQLERNVPFSRDESRACLASQQQAKKSPFPTFLGWGWKRVKGRLNRSSSSC